MAEKNLRAKIEQLRRIMHLVAKEKGISHPEVLKVSQKLDVQLNQYQQSAKQK